jgi:5'-nucleotidase
MERPHFTRRRVLARVRRRTTRARIGTMLTRRLLPAVLAAPLAAPALGPASAEAATRISLLHLNDFHSRHEPVSALNGACRAGQACFGGAARVMMALREAREAAEAQGRAPLTLDAGDAFLGSLFFTHHQGLAEAAVQRAWGVGAMALGNHEFDRGPDVLAAYAEAAGFPLLCANLDATQEPALAGRVRPALGLRHGAARLVVVGLVTPDVPTLSSPGPRLRFTDPFEAAERAVWEARRESVGTVVALSHMGLAADRRLAEEVVGLDAILGGHSHTLVAPPEIISGRAGVVPIVQAGAFGRYLGRLDLDLRADGRVVTFAQAMRELSAGVAEDAEVSAIVARFAAPLGELRARHVATLAEALPTAGCATGPCPLGALVADAMRREMRAEIGWQNAGGLRAGLPAGAVSWGDVLATLPFSNTVARLVLRGGDILAELEQGLDALPQPSGGYPQLSGLRVEVEPSRPPGRRVILAEVREPDGAWRRLDPARAYSVATNNFLRRGGDGYTVFAGRALEARDDGPLLEEAVVRRLVGGAPP